MYYRIAEITLKSEVSLPSYSSFSCEPAAPDIILCCGEKRSPDGEEHDTGNLKVRRLPDGWFLELSGKTDFGLFISGDYTRLCLAGNVPPVINQNSRAEKLIRVALEYLLIRRGYISLHAAAISVNGQAYAFSGYSGMGKSTRAAAWQEAAGAELISGDRPLIKADGMDVYGVPWDGKEQCFRNAKYPLKMICDIRRSEIPYVRAMSFNQRRRLLTQQSFLPMWDTEASTLQMINIARLAKTAKIVRMFCGPLPEDAKTIQDILERNEIKREEPEMKARGGFVLRNVVGEHVLMPTGDQAAQFKGTLVLTDVAAFIWEKLQYPVSREDLLLAVQDEYKVEEAVAARDLDALLEKLSGFGVIEEE